MENNKQADIYGGTPSKRESARPADLYLTPEQLKGAAASGGSPADLLCFLTETPTEDMACVLFAKHALARVRSEIELREKDPLRWLDRCDKAVASQSFVVSEVLEIFDADKTLSAQQRIVFFKSLVDKLKVRLK